MKEMQTMKSSSTKKDKDNKYEKIDTNETMEETSDNIDLNIEKENVLSVISKDEDDFKQVTPIKIEKSLKYCYKRLGNTFSFFGDRDGNPLFIIGPHWPMYFCFASLVTGGIALFFWGFWSFLHIFFKVIGIVSYSTFIFSYTYTFLINPGYPKHDLDSRTGEPRAKYRFCHECKMWVNIAISTNHCFDCNICVEGYDHHCPWVSKCIGRRNTNSFYVFVISTLCIFAYIVCALTNAQSRQHRHK